jgi:Deoxyhypusine synthase
MNRIGNLIVPNDNYCKFEDWLTPLLDQMLLEQKESGTIWSPSSFIRRLGKEINNEESIYYWAYKVTTQCTLTSRSNSCHDLERHPCLLPCTDRRVHWRHDLLPLLQKSGACLGHRTRHTQPKRTCPEISKSGDDHSWRWSL